MDRSILILLAFALFASCNPNKYTPEVRTLAPAPTFNEDSAYDFIAQQVAFGPRVPETEAHANCGDLLLNTLTTYGAVTVEQKDTVALFDGRRVPLRNIIASFLPENPKRILLCAHWDTRPIADEDRDRPHEPIDGACDGASGIGVLLEVARNISLSAPSVGVDIVFFDLEDQGVSSREPNRSPNEHGFCLGSRYWSQNTLTQTPAYGVLLDMVGAHNAVFTLEGVSMQYAESTTRSIWDVANQLGYNDHFRYNKTAPLIDDHTYINEIAGIPCVAIVQYDPNTNTNFGPFWHNHSDNMDIIDKKTLKVVGQTLLQVVYNEGK